MTFELYLVTNRTNGKCYVGQTTRGIPVRWMEHISEAKCGGKQPLHFAIRKYGAENFDVEKIYCSATNQEALNAAEQAAIKLWGAADSSKGYNATEGGEGGRLTPAALAARSAAIKEKYAADPDYKKRVAAAGVARWKDPAYRAKHTAALRAGWTKRPKKVKPVKITRQEIEQERQRRRILSEQARKDLQIFIQGVTGN
jgi:group I intron endonuclease